MLLTLSDDSLWAIIELLKFDDQMSLANVCQRLKKVVTQNWQRDSRMRKIIIDLKNRNLKKYGKYLSEYLRCTSSEVVVLELRNFELAFITDLKGVHFPRTLHFSLHNDRMSCIRYQRKAKFVEKLFPNLITCEIRGYVPDFNVCLFKNLQELNLGDDYKLDHHIFKEIFLNLSLRKVCLYFEINERFDEAAKALTTCESLEEICFNYEFLQAIFDSLKKIKNLRKIAFYWPKCVKGCVCKLIHKIFKQYGSIIETTYYNSTYSYRNFNCFDAFLTMASIRRFLLIKSNEISFWDIKYISERLSKILQEFYFVHYGHFTMEDVLAIVEQCTNLELLDLSQSKNIDVSLIEKVAEIISDQRENRTKPLLLRCYDTNINAMQLKTLSLPNELQISLKEKEIKNVEGNFGFEWRL